MRNNIYSEPCCVLTSGIYYYRWKQNRRRRKKNTQQYTTDSTTAMIEKHERFDEQFTLSSGKLTYCLSLSLLKSLKSIFKRFKVGVFVVVVGAVEEGKNPYFSTETSVYVLICMIRFDCEKHKRKEFFSFIFFLFLQKVLYTRFCFSSLDCYFNLAWRRECRHLLVFN